MDSTEALQQRIIQDISVLAARQLTRYSCEYQHPSHNADDMDDAMSDAKETYNKLAKKREELEFVFAGIPQFQRT